MTHRMHWILELGTDLNGFDYWIEIVQKHCLAQLLLRIKGLNDAMDLKFYWLVGHIQIYILIPYIPRD